ncbi:MAG: hypothetical protein V5A87_03750 [Candidatus Bipolaricaulota bacterium]
MNLSIKKGALFCYVGFIVAVAVVVTPGFGFSNRALAEENMLTDDRGDLETCYTDKTSCSSCRIKFSVEEMEDEYSFIDILSASVEKTNGSSSLLLMKLKVADYIPVATDTYTSYSFALDLDGDPDTGFRADQPPLGVFPDLGMDLWISLSLNRGRKKGFVFVGPKNIEDLNNNSGFLEVSFDQDRKTVVFSVPVEPVERKLTFAYLHKSPQFKLDLDKTIWVSFATKATSRTPDDNPLCDFHPDSYFRESDEGCLLSPLLER